MTVMTSLAGEQNPFVRYRERLDAYAGVEAGDLTDAEFVDLVERLNERVVEVAGVGFAVTPVIDGAELASALGLDVELTIKSEVDNVAGSHKARHLFGVALHLLIAALRGEQLPERLAIASCGNAALGAATVARALDIAVDVFVPTWADQVTVDALGELGARLTQCERREGEVGDPCYHRFREAVDDGARSFSVQGTDTPTTFDGGRTLGWEIAEQAPTCDALYVQVGGGALATSVAMALPGRRVYPVQAEGCAPLARAWKRLSPDFDFVAAAEAPDEYMTPWIDPSSFATGILDDVTYDWLALLRQTHASGAVPLVASEQAIHGAFTTARDVTGLNVCSTGTAGLAGLIEHTETLHTASGREHAVVIFSGVHRT